MGRANRPHVLVVADEGLSVRHVAPITTTSSSRRQDKLAIAADTLYWYERIDIWPDNQSVSPHGARSDP